MAGVWARRRRAGARWPAGLRCSGAGRAAQIVCASPRAAPPPCYSTHTTQHTPLQAQGRGGQGGAVGPCHLLRVCPHRRPPGAAPGVQRHGAPRCARGPLQRPRVSKGGDAWHAMRRGEPGMHCTPRGRAAPGRLASPGLRRRRASPAAVGLTPVAPAAGAENTYSLHKTTIDTQDRKAVTNVTGVSFMQYYSSYISPKNPNAKILLMKVSAWGRCWVRAGLLGRGRALVRRSRALGSLAPPGRGMASCTRRGCMRGIPEEPGPALLTPSIPAAAAAADRCGGL